MPRFFIGEGQINADTVTLTGDDAFHISRSLRMAVGEHITVCDGKTNEYDCELVSFSGDVTAKIISKKRTASEPPFFACIWQALPKGDKLDTVIQKSVECGASEIRLFESSRCIVRTDPATERKKSDRRQKIALEAAKQSGRGIIPQVFGAVSFDEMLRAAARADIPLFCYEEENTLPLGRALKGFRTELYGRESFTVSVVIGPEGGFSESEAGRAAGAGLIPVGLGKRILRTETVSTFLLGALSYEFELGDASSNA